MFKSTVTSRLNSIDIYVCSSQCSMSNLRFSVHFLLKLQPIISVFSTNSEACRFSKQLTVNEKDQCWKEMLRYKSKSSLALQKSGKVVKPNLKKCAKIKNLFRPNSFLIPAKMETAPPFLEVQALQWENDSNYNFLKKTLCKMLVVNDSTERTILLAKTYHNKQRWS